jgi:signal transduction histidine kinase
MSLELTSEQTIHIYRIIQELLTNAIKYVSKGEIRLSVSEEAGMFIVLYKDTGVGFDVNTFKGKEATFDYQAHISEKPVNSE